MPTKETATQAFEAVEEELRSISRQLYENPELAYEEYESSALLARFLTDNGFEVTYPAYGLDTAFEANVGSEGPRVVICAEYDALPEIGQACGHNIIATAALGAGVASATAAEELGYRVTVLGTPAEEGGGGKIRLLDAGAFEDCAASMMIHPGPGSSVDPRLFSASMYGVEFFGKEAHAAMGPQEGLNALDAFVQSYNSVSTLRQHLLPTDRVHCMINEAGVAPNVIPAYSRSEWIMRSESGERLYELMERVKACFEGAAMATGCRLELTERMVPYIDLVSNPVLVDLFKTNSEAIGRFMPRNVELGDPIMGSSDMGNVSHVVPSIHPGVFMGTGVEINHQPEFSDATVTPSGEQAMRDGALAMAMTIIDLAEQDLWGEL